MNLLSFSAYAKRRGCSQQYVSKMVKAGKIQLVDGKIDPALADEALARQADPNRAAVVAAHAAKRKDGRSSADRESEELPLETGRYVETPLSIAKAADAEYVAKLRKMEYEREVKKLVEVDGVTSAVADLVPNATSLLDSFPDRMAARVAAETDVRTVYAILEAECTAVRQQIADFARALAERLTANPS